MRTHKENIELTPHQIKLIKNMKLYRETKGVTQNDLARGMAVSQSYISLIERFEKAPSANFVNKFCNFLGITEEQLVNDIEVVVDEANLRRIEVFNEPGGKKTDALFINTNELVDKMGRVYVGMDLYALRAKDDAMFPAVKNGDFIVVKEYKAGATTIDADGRVVVARKKNEQHKIIVRRYDKEKDILKADNPEFQDIKAKDWEIMGIVIIAGGMRKV